MQTSVNNVSGGTATPDSFTYHLIDTADDHEVSSATFDPTGLTTVNVPAGTYKITEDPVTGYNEDVSSCASVSTSVDAPGSCTVANVFGNGLPPTTTSTTTTTIAPGVKQIKIHGSATARNNCTTHIEPQLTPDGTEKIDVTVGSDAFPDPHKGDPITLSNVTVKVVQSAATIQTGVDAGIISDGQKVPSTLTIVVTGDGTKEKTRSFTAHNTATLVVNQVTNKASPLVYSFSLPSSTWTPASDQQPVFFSEKAMKIAARIDLTHTALRQVINSTDQCTASATRACVALNAQGSGPPPTKAPPTSSTGSSTSGPTQATLPATGTSTRPGLALAVVLIDVGLLALGSTARRRRRALER